MGRGVYESERTFRDEVDECAAMLAPALGFDIRDVLYPEPAAVDAARAHLSTTAATQPALFVVLLLGSGDHELLISVHHIVADGWSVGIINRELRVLYDAFVAGRPSPLPEPPIQYGDFACRQREWLVGEVFESERRYWLEHLHARPAPLELQTDFPRPRQRALAGARAARARRRHVRISGRQRGAGFQARSGRLHAVPWRAGLPRWGQR